MNLLIHKGTDDKLVAMDSYAIVVTDKASSFFQEIKGHYVKHKSNIGLLNQLFDGRGEKSPFAHLRECIVPQNLTSMSLEVQPQPFFRALMSIGKTVWMDSRFTEHFLFAMFKPFR